MGTPRYDDLGQRMTDCCGTHSIYHDGYRHLADYNSDGPTLVCERCYKVVPVGQGDGNEFTNKEKEHEHEAGI